MAKPNSFFMFCFGDFATKLAVPTTFVEDHGLHRRCQVSLRLITQPAAASWAVKIRKIDSDFYMVDGWSKFVEDNHILEMKLLNFHIVGNSILHVAIYGHDSCLELELQSVEQQVRQLRFIKRVKEYHILDQRPEIPKEFSDAMKMGNKGKILLKDWKGRKWAISITHRNAGICAFSAGWKKFLNANNLEVGAILLFDFDMEDSSDVLKVVCLGAQDGEEMLARATYGGFIPSH
ncbi:B3 domain-containing protein REM6-like isoform X2 [Salvia hispanica]|uniref:B3 domain-containing protein REM6-like isoform X2 n=1 Tax=Salvia hispanica TaxID=49212 RepID=UPI0020099BC7|nr:B3 domain-containing protein REM6-like isoform X2 [Salvia hispanica]